jgi:hypothetical protein
MNEDNKKAIQSSQAGIRFIAQMTFYNNADFDRLKEYIQQSYTTAALEQKSVERRLAELQEWHQESGRLRVEEVASAEKHYLFVLMESEQGQKYSVRLTVSEDYPHHISDYAQRPILTE